MKKNYMKIILCFAMCMFMALTLLPVQEAQAAKSGHKQGDYCPNHTNNEISVYYFNGTLHYWLCPSDGVVTHEPHWNDDEKCGENICTGCGKTYYAANLDHDWSDKNGICKNCGYTCSHHDWSNNDGECIICHVTCGHDGQTGATCNICGKSLHTHSYNNLRNLSYQWTGSTCDASVKCDTCDDVKRASATGTLVTDTAPTCSATGTGHYAATFSDPFTNQNSSNIDISIDPNAHNWQYAYDTTTHWKECSLCHTVDANTVESHTYSSNKPSYSWNGTTCNASLKCDGCDYAQTAQATGVENITQAPTCSATGLATYTATFSSPFTTQTKDNVEVAINPDAHKWDDGKTTKEPTCTEKGVYTYTCEYNSEHTKAADIDIDKDAHSWDDGKVTKAATCAAKGVLTYTCKHNSEHTKTEDIAIDKDAHTWDEGKVTKAATCTATGEKTYTCKNDSTHTKIEEIAIDKDAHTWDEGKVTKEATCTAKGEKTYTCKNDPSHTKKEETAIDKDAHSWDDGKITKEATCAAKGVLTYTCKNDSSHTKTEDIAIDSNAHSWDDGKVTKAATCTEAGEKVYTCKNDNTHTRTEVIPAGADHKLTATAAKEATCTADGNSAYWTCSVCKKHFSDANGKTEIKEGSWVIKAHHPADKIVTDAAVLPTCEKTGLTAGSHCEECGEIIVAQEVVEAAGHKFMDWHTNNAGSHENHCYVCRHTKTVACEMTVLPGFEEITFCPICGYCGNEGVTLTPANVYLKEYDGTKTGVPRYYILEMDGAKYLILSFENNGQETRTEGKFTFTLPEDLAKGNSFVQISTDGTETPVEMTENYGYHRMTLDYTPEGKEPIQVMILKIVASESEAA